MRGIGLSMLLICLPLAAQEPPVPQAAVLRIRIQDVAITPVTARFIERALREADQQRAECIVIELDTPGGLLQSTQEIVRSMLASRVPVVVYVSPSGGRAASAGRGAGAIRVIPGDRVQVGVSPYDPTHGFITFRLREGQTTAR